MSEQEAGPLLPCPFCSGEAKIFRSVVTTTVFCPHTNCHVGPSAKAYSDSEAIGTWNRRTMPAPAIPVDAIRKMMQWYEQGANDSELQEVERVRKWLDQQAVIGSQPDTGQKEG
jgi:hypothetical protein